MTHADLRQPWIPLKPKAVFITEAPPPIETGRYFYRPFVPKGDSLFLEMMKLLFEEEVASFETVKALRREKPYFLERFKNEGFMLAHGAMQPMPHHTATQRVKVYKEQLPELVKALLAFGVKPKTPIILISAVVYQAIAAPLKAMGWNVLNERSIEYPNSGQQANFRKRLAPLLASHGLVPKGIVL